MQPLCTTDKTALSMLVIHNFSLITDKQTVF